MSHSPLLKMQNLCGIYTVYSAFHLFLVLQTKMNNVQDGKISIDFFQCEKLLLPNRKFRLKLIRERPNF